MRREKRGGGCGKDKKAELFERTTKNNKKRKTRNRKEVARRLVKATRGGVESCLRKHSWPRSIPCVGFSVLPTRIPATVCAASFRWPSLLLLLLLRPHRFQAASVRLHRAPFRKRRRHRQPRCLVPRRPNKCIPSNPA